MPSDGVESGSDEDSNLQVLLVDDDSRQQEVGSALLSIWGIRPIIARNGAEAMTLVMDHHFDIVLIGVVMPVMDGLSATREIRRFEQENGSRKKTPIAAYSSTELSPAVPQRTGLNAMLLKPADAVSLGACLRRWCGDRFPTASPLDPARRAGRTTFRGKEVHLSAGREAAPVFEPGMPVFSSLHVTSPSGRDPVRVHPS